MPLKATNVTWGTALIPAAVIIAIKSRETLVAVKQTCQIGQVILQVRV